MYAWKDAIIVSIELLPPLTQTSSYVSMYVHTYGTVHRKHDSNSVCQLALFVVITPLTVNIFDYLLAFNR